MSLFFKRFFSCVSYERVLLLLPAVVAVLFIPSQLFPFSGIKAYFFVGVLSIIVMLLARKMLISKQALTFSLSRLDIFLCLIVAGMCITSLLGVDPQLSFFSTFDRGVGVGLWMWVLAYYLLLKNSIKKHAHSIRLLDWSLVVAALLISVSVWCAAYGVLPAMFLGGFQGNSSLAGAVLLLTVPSFLYLAHKYYNEKKKAQMYGIVGALLVVCLNPLFVSLHGIGESRGVVLSVFFSLLSALIFYHIFSTKRITSIFARIFLAVFVGVCAMCTLLVFKEGSQINTFFKSHSGANRLVFWDTAFRAIHDRPFVGYGNETFEYSFFSYFDPVVYRGQEGWVDKPHNAYIEIIHDNGVIVFALYLLSIGYGYYLLYKLGKDKSYRVESTIYFFVLTAYLLQNALVFDGPVSLILMSVLFARFSRQETSEYVFVVPKKLLIVVIICSMSSLFFLSYRPFVEGNIMSDFIRFPFVNTKDSIHTIFDTSNVGGITSSAYLANQIMNTVERDPQKEIKNYSFFVDSLRNAVLKEKSSEKSFPAQLFSSRAYIYQFEKTGAREELKMAQLHAKNAIMLSRLNPEGYWVFAYAYALDGNEKESLLAARTVIEIDPELREAYSRLVFLARKLGNTKVENGTIEDAKKYFPDFDKTQ